VAAQSKINVLSDIDPRLLEEAFNRARREPLNNHLGSEALLSAIFAEARRGARNMHELCSAAARARKAA
jgi:hypothetical protein